MAISCLIVDDEPLALDLLEKYVRKTPFLEFSGRCNNAVEALDLLASGLQIQVLFLDIQMPELSGMELARLIPATTRVVFTTAFDQYALDGYKVNALDYLLKPFNYQEFLTAALKAKAWAEQGSPMAGAAPTFIFVKSEYKQVRILLNEIVYVEGLKDYLRIWLTHGKPVLTLLTMKALEQQLPAEHFMRIHRSYIVALDKIHAVERSQVLMNDRVRITIADNYRERFNAFLNGRSAG